MPYIHFTEEQKMRAGSVDLVDYLQHKGEKLIRSGPEYRLASDRSVTVRGNEWFDHATKEGGGPISFLQHFCNLSYPEAVTTLLNGEQGQVFRPANRQREDAPKEFSLPCAGKEMRRLYAYLLKKRLIDRDVLNTFVRTGLIFESCEKSKDGQREYHNAVFVGKDEHGVARHAHKRSVSDMGKPFRINVEGSDPRCSFHWNGTSDRLYVFEGPIDLLSFITLYPKGWQEHSYVALCGTAEHAMLWMLEQNSAIRNTILCLDHDEAGIEASGRLAESLRERGHHASVLRSEQKDWNEDVKAKRGLEAQPAEEHPQLVAAPEICGRIGKTTERVKLEWVKTHLPNLLHRSLHEIHSGHTDKAMERMEFISALALAAYSREMRQIGSSLSAEELAERLCSRIRPHQNRGNIAARQKDLVAQYQEVIAMAAASGCRSLEEKRRLADAWLELAISFAKIPIKLEADELKQRQKQNVHCEPRLE